MEILKFLSNLAQDKSVYLPFYTFIGAFTLYVLNRLQKKQPFSLFSAISIQMDNPARPMIILLDMVISSLIGMVVVIPITSPTTITQALFAGLGMTGILSAHTKDVK